MTSTTTEAESQQLLRTVEMFEAITEAQPDDYQSLLILKEAYDKLDRQDDYDRTARKLAQVYLSSGEIKKAITEYENLLRRHTDDDELRKTIAELKENRHAPQQQKHGAPSTGEHSKPAPSTSNLVIGTGAPSLAAIAKGAAEADQALANVLIAGKLVTAQAVRPLLQRLKDERPSGLAKAQPVTLLQLLTDEQIAKMDDLLTLLVEKSGLPYLPLSTYDADRDLGAQVDVQICVHHCLVPFDAMSRSVLVATANPFDTAARELVKGALHKNPFWYVATPAEITAAIRAAHGMDTKGNATKRSSGKP